MLFVSFGGLADEEYERADVFGAEHLVSHREQFSFRGEERDHGGLHPVGVAKQNGAQGVLVHRIPHQQRLDACIGAHHFGAAGEKIDALAEVLAENFRPDPQILVDVLDGVAAVGARDEKVDGDLHQGDEPDEQQKQLPAEMAEAKEAEGHDGQR